MGRFQVFVFGSCHYSGVSATDDAVGNGGYAGVIESNGKIFQEISGGFASTTNARMDLLAISKALQAIPVTSEVEVFVTNGYIFDTVNKGWLESWKKKGFKKKKHVDLWKEIDAEFQRLENKVKILRVDRLKNHPAFLRAERLAKEISIQKNLPKDPTFEGLVNPLLLDSQNNDATEMKYSSGLFIEESPIENSICVDASCSGNPGPTEYRGTDFKTRKQIFQNKYPVATNNIGEFLAIVHALAHIKKQGLDIDVVYSDSLYAISWVKDKECRTNFDRTDETKLVFEHIERAILWLQTNDYKTRVLKWQTREWGEIPADYGRK